jgi:hypothetical protein
MSVRVTRVMTSFDDDTLMLSFSILFLLFQKYSVQI